MDVELCRHALDRVPLSLIVDDSTALVNLNYFWLRDRVAHTGQWQRWEDVPVVHPESFTREWAEWCAAHGVRGKFSVVPCPAGLGRLDEGLPLFDEAQLESWLGMCRELIVPNFDVTPELLTHTYVLDPKTLRPLASGAWEQFEWRGFTEDDRLDRYIALACRILVNVGLPPQGVTRPGGFGHADEEMCARVVGAGCRAATDNPAPYFFGGTVADDVHVPTPVWFADRQAGTAVGQIKACAVDRTGSWTGYGQVDADYYITADLQGGRLPAVIDAGSPCVLCSHWQGMYGLHDDDRRGFRTLQTVVERLRQRDPDGERTGWRTCSEITTYACARELVALEVDGETIQLDLPLRVPELTLRLPGQHARGVAVEGELLRKAHGRRAFQSGTFYHDGPDTLLAFDPPPDRRTVSLRVYAG